MPADFGPLRAQRLRSGGRDGYMTALGPTQNMDRIAPMTGTPTALADQLPLVSVVITNHNYAR